MLDSMQLFIETTLNLSYSCVKIIFLHMGLFYFQAKAFLLKFENQVKDF